MRLEQYTVANIIAIARVCHQANKAHCENIGDNSQKNWEDAEEWQRESAIKGVRWRIDNPDAPTSAQHDAWMADKIAEGWKYGEIKDPEAKTHPCIVLYDELPNEQRAKDAIFVAIVNTLKFTI